MSWWDRQFNKRVEIKDWTPTFTGSGSMTFINVTITTARYAQIGKLVYLYLDAEGTVDGTPNKTIIYTLPVTAAYKIIYGWGAVYDGVTLLARHRIGTDVTKGEVAKDDATNWNAGPSRYVRVGLLYEAA